MWDGKSSEVSTRGYWEYFGGGESEPSADTLLGMFEACGQLTVEMTTGEEDNKLALASDRKTEREGGERYLLRTTGEEEDSPHVKQLLTVLNEAESISIKF